MPVCTHTKQSVNEHSVQTRGNWGIKGSCSMEKILRYSALRKKKKQTSLPVLQGCRSGVKPAWLNLCFLSRLSKQWQGFSSPEVMMASFLAEIWKEQEILWLSFERWLYYWDTTNKGWCRPGIPHLALSLSFLPLWSLSSQLSLYFCPRQREKLQYLGLIRKHIHLQ